MNHGPFVQRHSYLAVDRRQHSGSRRPVPAVVPYSAKDNTDSITFFGMWSPAILFPIELIGTNAELPAPDCRGASGGERGDATSPLCLRGAVHDEAVRSTDVSPEEVNSEEGQSPVTTQPGSTGKADAAPLAMPPPPSAAGANLSETTNLSASQHHTYMTQDAAAMPTSNLQ
ncbi:hypothetical protein MRX96_014371 [Rhipicephalus microplus]